MSLDPLGLKLPSRKKTQLRSEKSFKRYLGQAQQVVSEPLLVLLQLPRHHLPRPEVETSQVHRVSQVAGQLWFTPELLPRRTEEEGEDGRQIA